MIHYRVKPADEACHGVSSAVVTFWSGLLRVAIMTIGNLDEPCCAGHNDMALPAVWHTSAILTGNAPRLVPPTRLLTVPFSATNLSDLPLSSALIWQTANMPGRSGPCLSSPADASGIGRAERSGGLVVDVSCDTRGGRRG